MYTAEARSYKPNGYNLYNMAGNVAAWTADSYRQEAYLFNSKLKPKAQDTDNPIKVLRGGSWSDAAYFLQVATRAKEHADSARSYIGCRTVVSAPGPNSMKGNVA